MFAAQKALNDKDYETVQVELLMSANTTNAQSQHLMFTMFTQVKKIRLLSVKLVLSHGTAIINGITIYTHSNTVDGLTQEDTLVKKLSIILPAT